MPDAATVLIPPDNRLLGWGMGDLTLYGAQPTSDMVIGRAPPADGDAVAPPPATAGGTLQSPAPTEGAIAADDTSALLADSANQPAITPAPTAPGPALADHAGPQGEPSAPAIPLPIGSGSFVDAPTLTPLQTVAEQGQSSQSPLAPDAVATTLAPVAPVLADTTAATEALGQTLGDTIGTVQTLVPDAVALPDVGATLGTLTGDAGAAIDTIPLSAFAGTDPLGGITTLVSMVESADLFDLGQAVTPLATEAAPGSILDALVADEAPPTLLGDDGAADHILDDHGIHVGL